MQDNFIKAQLHKSLVDDLTSFAECDKPNIQIGNNREFEQCVIKNIKCVCVYKYYIYVYNLLSVGKKDLFSLTLTSLTKIYHLFC